MSEVESFYEYKEELELIQAQNPIEAELYSVIAKVLRQNIQKGEISLRDYSVRRQSKNNDACKAIRGNSGFPDFLIRTRKKSENAEVLGAVEIKTIVTNLEKPSESNKQLDDHIKKYKKVIYTNGLKWIYYNNSDVIVWEIDIGSFNQINGFEWSLGQWKVLLKKLNDMKFIV